MKNFLLGFFVCLSLSLGIYLFWETYRHVPIMIKQVPIYIFKSTPGSPLRVPPPPREANHSIPDGSVAKTFYF
jgi:hypothetical protein